jgi:hypothetical protein
MVNVGNERKRRKRRKGFSPSQGVTLIQIPIKPDDLQKIEQILRERDNIITPYPSNIFDPYSLSDYLSQTKIHGNTFNALFDRNIYSYIIQAVKNNGLKTTELQRAACALLAFFQLSNTLIEPGIATYEYIDSGHYQQAVDELSLFRAIDNLDSQILVDIALERTNLISIKKIQQHEKESVEKIESKNWELHYGVALKLASIELADGKPIEKLKTFLEWMHKDYIFISPATVFGIIYFSNKRVKNMLKKLCGDKSTILRGIRNVAWDMFVVNYWAKKAIKCRETGVVWLLCTEDKVMKEVSHFVVATYNKSKEELKDKTKWLFEEYYKKDGASIYEIYESYNICSRDTSRKKNKLNSQEELLLDIDLLEKQLISAVSKNEE